MGITQLLDPLRAQDAKGMPVLIVALAVVETRAGEVQANEVMAIAVGEDGQVNIHRVDELRVDFRYDWKNHAWVDAQPLGGDDGEG